MLLHFLGADIPTVPLLNVVVNRTARVFGEGSIINVTLDWMQPENFDQFDIDRYDINVTSTSGIHAEHDNCMWSMYQHCDHCE